MQRIAIVVVPWWIAMSGFSHAAETVVQKDKQFSVETMMVAAGESVTFTNADQVTHDITVKKPDGSSLPALMQKPGDSAAIKFDQVGSYRVLCLIHPKMKMSVEAK